MKVDLRSDTVTKPTPHMLEVMHGAPVGDDVFGEDPSVKALEAYAANLFGMEAALYCPSGTMTNQIAIRVHTRPGDEVICDRLSHIYNYEGGGIAANSGASVRLLDGKDGHFTAEMVAANLNQKTDIHSPYTRLVSAENTCNKGGGTVGSLAEFEKIKAICTQNNLKFHLDGARLFNALAVTGETTAAYGQVFDSISICLSKGLGGPVGSLLLGNDAFIQGAKRVRKLFGGGMRQCGSLAAAGLYALQHHIQRLKEDHHRAQRLAATIKTLPMVDQVLPVETNIIMFTVKGNPLNFLDRCAEKGILLIHMGQGKLRAVTHLDVDDEQIDYTVAVLKTIQDA